MDGDEGAQREGVKDVHACMHTLPAETLSGPACAPVSCAAMLWGEGLCA